MHLDTSAWGWPQWTMLVLMLLSLMVFASKHGEPREPYNAPIGFISFGFSMFLLIAGGFFE